jgi:hypothetical protein
MLIDKLRELPHFIDNDYLCQYARLIEIHSNRGSRKSLTNEHHIVPRSWFKIMQQEVDNSPHNLVTLTYREHVLAHYFLCLCTSGDLQYANELALIGLLNRKCLTESNRQLVKHLPLYNTIYESYIKHRKSNYQLYKGNK